MRLKPKAPFSRQIPRQKTHLFRSVLLPLFMLGSMVCILVAAFFNNSNANHEGTTHPDKVSVKSSSALPPVTPKQSIRLKGDAFHWVAVGDTGSGSKFQFKVADQLLKAYEKQPYSIALVLGDIIYPDGNLDLYGKERFTKPYLPLLEKSVLFKVALGNHDMVWNQLAKTLAFYGMPDRYYQFQEGPISFFAIDTNNFNLEQQAWLNQQLKAVKTPWKVVYGHHPVYSSGFHGITVGLKNTLEPILVRHHVNFYLAGHDHHYERFEPIEGVTHIVSGGGGAYIRPTVKKLRHSLLRRSIYHFIEFWTDDNTMEMQAVDMAGNRIDHFIVDRTEQKAPVLKKTS